MRALLLLALAAGCVHRAPPPPVDLSAPLVRAPLAPAVQAVLALGAADLDVSVRRDAIATLLTADPAPAGGAWGQRGRFDPSAYVQRAAVDRLALRIDETPARDLLRALLADPAADPWARGAAPLALARGGRDGKVPATELAADRTRLAEAAAAAQGSRAGALLLAAAVAGDTPARTRLAEQLSAGNLPLELWFFRAIGESRVDALVGPLVQALDRVEPEIQLAVAAALLELGSPAGERALAAAVTESEDRALEALEYVVDVRAPAADAVLRGALAAAPLARDAATLALFGRGEGDIAAVLRLLAEGDAELRVLAATAAGVRLRADAALQGQDRLRVALREALPEADPSLQLALIGALGGSPVAADRAALTELLADESIRVRVAAAAALAR